MLMSIWYYDYDKIGAEPDCCLPLCFYHVYMGSLVSFAIYTGKKMDSKESNKHFTSHI